MAKTKKRNTRTKKRKGKIKIKQTARIKPKKDGLMIDTTGLGRVPTIVPSNVAVFKIKIKKK